MPSCIKQSKHYIGFGLTNEEATIDAYVCACIPTLESDTDGIFAERRKELCPWMPTGNMLHISGIGCLVYDNKKITETSSGKQVIVAAAGDSVFYYLSTLFGTKLSYTDIVCVLREEIDTFFSNISKDFVSIESMSIIQVQQESTNYQPDVIYTTKFNFVIGCSEEIVGLKWHGEDSYYTCHVDNSTQQITAMYRLLYRSGYTIVDNELRELDEQAYKF